MKIAILRQKQPSQTEYVTALIQKVTLRPKPIARAEEAAAGVALLKPRWWEAFENYLRVNKDHIQAKCDQCASKAA